MVVATYVFLFLYVYSKPSALDDKLMLHAWTRADIDIPSAKETSVESQPRYVTRAVNVATVTRV
jgi:hypothetical protein